MQRSSILIALTLLGASARADESDRARELYEHGQVAFESGRYAEAARSFEQSYELSRRPPLLWDAAQAYRKQYTFDSDVRGLRRARELFRNFSELAVTEQERADGAREARETERLIREATPPPKKPLTRQWWFWTSIGAGVVVVATSVGLGVGLTQSPPAPRTTGGNWMPFP